MLKTLLTSRNTEDFHKAIFAYQSRIQFLIARFCPSFETVEKEEALGFIQSKLEEDDFARLRKYKPETSTPQTFLNRLTRNLIIDYIRKNRGRKVLFSKIEKLSKTHQIVFKLKFWQGYHDREVYRLLDMQFDLKLSPDQFDRLLREVHDALTDLNMWRLISDNRWVQSYDEVDPAPGTAFVERSVSPEDLYIQKEADEKRETVEEVLKERVSKLTAEEKFILVSRFCDGKSARQISETLNYSTKNVYRKLQSILKQLAEALGKAGIDDFGEIMDSTSPIEGIFDFQETRDKGG